MVFRAVDMTLWKAFLSAAVQLEMQYVKMLSMEQQSKDTSSFFVITYCPAQVNLLLNEQKRKVCNSVRIVFLNEQG